MTPYGFMQTVKGILFIEKDANGKHLSQCIDFNEDVKEYLHREYASESWTQALESIATSQGFD